ncbi:MAG: heme-binding protein [Alphaproteobacteria bacterium]
MAKLTLAEASQIVDVALAAGRERNFAPLTVAVLDAGGHLVALKREDRSSLLRPQIAVGKAWGVLGMGFGGRELERRAKTVPAFFGALSVIAEGRMVPVPGGVLIRDGAGEIVGAVGISGDASVNDEACAVAGIKAAGLAADTGDPA